MRPHGYNLTAGGEGTIGYKHTEDTKLKLSRMKKGIPTHKQSDETRAKISFANKGRKLTEEQLKKLKESKIGLVLTEEHKEKLSKALKGRPKSDTHKLNTKKYWDSLEKEEIESRITPMIDSRRKRVIMLDINDLSVIYSFESMRSAADWIRNNTTHDKASHTRISFVCGDTDKCAYGFRWDYK